MKARNLLFALGFAGASALTVYAQAKDEKKPADKPASAQPAKPGDKSASQPSEAEMAKMMESWKKAATPGANHAKLEPLVGKWTFVTKARMAPDQPWEETPGKAEFKWTLGKRQLIQEVKANPGPKDAMMGAPFEGFGMTGYDNTTQKYYNVWTDNMGTGIMHSTGSADSSGKTFTYASPEGYICPMTGEKKTPKSVLKIAGDDKLVFEMYDKGPDGKEYMNLEVTYTRQK